MYFVAWIQRALFIVPAFVVASCGPPAFVQEATKFRDAMASAHTAFIDYHTTGADLRTQSNIIAAAINYDTLTGQACEFKTRAQIENEAELQDPPSALASSEVCRLQAQRRTATAVILNPITEQIVDPKSLALAQLLHQYADGIAAIAGANDLDTLNSNLEGARGAAVQLIQGIASASGGAAALPPQFAELVDPISMMFKIVTFEYLEHKRMQALRQIVGVANDHMKDAERVLTRQVLNAYDRVATAYQHEYSTRMVAYDLLRSRAAEQARQYELERSQPVGKRNVDKTTALGKQVADNWQALETKAKDLRNLEPIQEVVDSGESVVIPFLAPESLVRGARCGRPNIAARRTAAACDIPAI